jgi:hypothetical protein
MKGKFLSAERNFGPLQHYRQGSITRSACQVFMNGPVQNFVGCFVLSATYERFCNVINAYKKAKKRRNKVKK